MRTARLEEIVRQKDPALKETVEQLARGEVRDAIARLDDQGRVHEIGDRADRMQEIARAYAEHPEGTLVISPDNKSRMELNSIIHAELQERGAVKGEEHSVRVLTPRQDMTGVDRTWAAQYEPGDVVRYSKGSHALGINPGAYAKVEGFDRERNLLTVERGGEKLTYDPRRLQGVIGVPGERAGIQRRRPRAVYSSRQNAAESPIASWAPSRALTKAATLESSSTPAARSASILTKIGISITDTR